MRLRKKENKGLTLYAILDRGTLRGPLTRLVRKAVTRGADIIQYRAKAMNNPELIKSSKELGRLIKKRKKLFIMNDRVDVALAVGADGVHLGSGDLSIPLARKLLGKKALIGRTAHSLGEAIEAHSQGADYISVGPVFETPFKKYLRPRGVAFVKKIRRKIKGALFCVGGINKENIGALAKTGIDGAAQIRGIFK